MCMEFHSISQITKSLLHTKCMRRHPNVISAWDFSAADITLDTNKVIGSSDTVNARKLLVITEQFNLTQHQREINRPSSDAVLDLLFYTNPNLVSKVEVVPGMSDHLAVFTMLDVRSKTY